MPQPQLAVYRHDRKTRALITLVGEIDFESAPLVRVSLERCLRDGIRSIDVDLTPVAFCDCSGLNEFLHAAQRTTEAGGTLRLHHPPTTLARILEVAGCGFLLLGLPSGSPSPPLDDDDLAAPGPVPPRRPVPLASLPSGNRR